MHYLQNMMRLSAIVSFNDPISERTRNLHSL
jgi:hypothetical protein